MKKSFLNLRNLGLVLVASASMAMVSCGGDEAAHEAEAEALVEDIMGDLDAALEDVAPVEDDAAAEGETCGDGKCGEGHDEEGMHAEGTCGEGKCGGMTEGEGAEEGEHKCEEGKCGE